MLCFELFYHVVLSGVVLSCGLLHATAVGLTLATLKSHHDFSMCPLTGHPDLHECVENHYVIGWHGT